MNSFHNVNLVLVVVGCSGSGKSTFAVRYLESNKLACRFIFDPIGEYASKLKQRPCRTIPELRASIATGFVCFDPHALYPGDPVTAFENFCEWSWTVAGEFSGQKILFADEVWKYCTPNKIPKPLAQIIQDGRKRGNGGGIGLLATTQRPNRLNETIIAEATELVSFKLTGGNALEYLEKNCPEFPVAELPGLPMLAYIGQNLQSGAIHRAKIKF